MLPEYTHPVHVWSSYAIFAVIVLWQYLQPRWRRRRLLREIRQQIEERRLAREAQR